MKRSMALGFVLLFASSALGQVVQLPSVSNFSVRTSVLVPDSGGAYLGGVSRASAGSNRRGEPGWSPLGRNGARAGAVAGSGVMVHATIIDHEELDAAVLEEARALRAAKGIELPEAGSRIALPPETSPIESVRSIKERLVAEDAEQEADAERDYLKALAYEGEGRTSLARSHYRVAIRKSTGDVKQKATERLRRLK